VDEWTQEQLAAAVGAYRLMQLRSADRLFVNKAKVYRELSELHGRSPKAWEYRMQNISHVLDDLQHPWLAGLRPAANVGPEVTQRLIKLLSDNPLFSALTATSGQTRAQMQEERTIAEGTLAFSPLNAEDQRRKVLATIVRRQGQGAFRSALLEAYGRRCAMTGCAVADVLEAAHVYPYQGDFTNAPTNGLLLRSDVHTLFDLYLISVEPQTLRVKTAPALLATEYGELNGSPLARPVDPAHLPRGDLLKWHRSQCRW